MVVLRNRAYLGEVYYRGVWHRATDHHQPILEDPSLFDRAQKIIEARGSEYSRRASNSSSYLLAGRVICAACQQRYIGTAAAGNKHRYRYYTCYSANRYGRDRCGSDRLPADQLEAAVLDRLLEVLADSDLIARAVEQVARHREESDKHLRAELAAVAGDAAKAEESIDRYLTAFEAGALPQRTCGPRVQALADKVAQLRGRADELRGLLARENRAVPEDAELEKLRGAVTEAVAGGTPAVVKTLIEALVHDVTVWGRERIVPTFRLPDPPGPTVQPGDATKVRALPGSVPPAGLEPAAKRLEGACSIH